MATIADPTEAIDWGTALDDTDVTVYFASPGEHFDGRFNWGDWSRYDREQVFDALSTYSDVSNLTFRQVGSPADADFILIRSYSLRSYGNFNPPDPDHTPLDGLGWFNSAPWVWSGPLRGLLEPGAFTFQTLIHEFGHGLGLAHPHDEGGTSPILPTPANGVGLDQTIYTVMSYNYGWYDGPLGAAPTRNYGYNLTPSALDIALIQDKYGANTEHNASDTTYRLPMQNLRGTGYSTIWDAGGIDTIIANGDRDTVIDLRPATLAPTEAHGGGGYLSRAEGIYGGFTIAHGVTIENARSGSGDDLLRGNSADNLLDGGAGSDTMNGGAGDDLYVVDDAGDRVNERPGAGRDTIEGDGVDINLLNYENVEMVRLVGSAPISARGDGEDNTIRGNLAANLLQGAGGDDHLRAGLGDDELHGNGGDDMLFGQSGDDTIIGGSGNDRLIGDTGDDSLTGGGGADVFVIDTNAGFDTIADFQPGIDKVELNVFGIEDYADVAARMIDSGDGVHIVFGALSTVLISSLQSADLDAGDFMI